MDWMIRDIRVVRFPGEQCGHHESAERNHHIRAADVAEFVGIAKIVGAKNDSTRRTSEMVMDYYWRVSMLLSA